MSNNQVVIENNTDIFPLELMEELYGHHQRIFHIEKMLRTFFHEKALRESEFSIDEIVEVVSENDKLLGEGIIDGIFHGMNYGFEPHEIKKYLENNEKYNERAKEIRYKVRAIKKDGSKSNRSAFGRSSYSSNKTLYSPYKRKKTTT